MGLLYRELGSTSCGEQSIHGHPKDFLGYGHAAHHLWDLEDSYTNIDIDIVKMYLHIKSMPPLFANAGCGIRMMSFLKAEN